MIKTIATAVEQKAAQLISASHMQCEQCQATPASVFLIQIKDGQKTERWLCEICAGPSLQTSKAPATVSAEAQKSIDEIIGTRPSDCPLEIELNDSINARQLAEALCVQPYRIVASLIQNRIFVGVDTPLGFAKASLVCTRFGVTARRAGGRDSA